jgi:site-specific recombinase XerC
VHVATWIEAGTHELAAPNVKLRLAAIRHLFDWLVTGQVVPVNPTGLVRGPRHLVTSGQTPVLDPSEARALLDSIDVLTHAGLRDRALIGLMVSSFARHRHGNRVRSSGVSDRMSAWLRSATAAIASRPRSFNTPSGCISASP